MGKRGPPATGQVPPQDSVFERRSTRQHFNILGRKQVGTLGARADLLPDTLLT